MSQVLTVEKTMRNHFPHNCSWFCITLPYSLSQLFPRLKSPSILNHPQNCFTSLIIWEGNSFLKPFSALPNPWQNIFHLSFLKMTKGKVEGITSHGGSYTNASWISSFVLFPDPFQEFGLTVNSWYLHSNTCLLYLQDLLAHYHGCKVWTIFVGCFDLHLPKLKCIYHSCST